MSRAILTGTYVSFVPCNTKIGGASGRAYATGDDGNAPSSTGP